MQATAMFAVVGRRQLLPNDARFNVKDVAEEIAAIVIEGHDDPARFPIWKYRGQNPHRRSYSKNRQGNHRGPETTVYEGTRKLALSSWLASTEGEEPPNL